MRPTVREMDECSVRFSFLGVLAIVRSFCSTWLYTSRLHSKPDGMPLLRGTEGHIRNSLGGLGRKTLGRQGFYQR